MLSTDGKLTGRKAVCLGTVAPLPSATARANIAVAYMWSEAGPCNSSHRKIAG